jgi:hypothetical protein
MTVWIVNSSQVKSSLGATYSHSERSDPNVVPPSVVGYDGDPGVRPWEELLEVAMLP